MEPTTLIQEHQELTDYEVNLLVTGPIGKAIAYMALPLMLNALAIAAATFADAYVAGKLGASQLAAVGIGGQIWFGMIIMAIAIATGANALVSRFWGAQDFREAIEAARQSIFAAILFGVVSAFLGIMFTEPLLRLLGASPSVQLLGSSYLKIQFLAQIPLTILWVCHSIFRAKGQANLPTLIMAMVTVAIVFLDFALCLSPWHLGIAGIGISWLVSSTLGCILMLVALKFSNLSQCMEISKEMPLVVSKKWLWRILRIGLPTCLQDLAWVAGNFVLFLIFALTANPTAYQAAWAVGLRVEDVAAGMPIFALSMGVATVVGQNLGAKKLQRAEAVGWQAAGYGFLIMLAVGAVMFFFAKTIASAMTSDPEVIRYSTEYLQVLGLSEPITVVWLTLFGAMEGAGYTLIPMFLWFLCVLVIRLPLAYFLTINCGLGALGAWLAIAITSCFGALLAVFCFKHGAWKHHKI